MKKLISILLSAVLLLGTVPAFAENAPEDAVAADAVTTDTKNQVTITADIASNILATETDATFELFTVDGQSLATATEHIARDTKSVTFTFDVPQYEIGTHFMACPTEGIDSFKYYEETYPKNAMIRLPTYKYIDAKGNEAISTGISITINPALDKPVNVYYNAMGTSTDGARIINGTTMVPARALAEFIGFNVRYDSDYNVEVISLAGKDMYFNVDTAYTTIFGTDLFAPQPTIMIDGTVYIALRTFADAIGSELEVKDYGTHMDINMSESKFVSDYFSKLSVNQWGISSRTKYMVWVSLSEYKVRLYEGSQYKWRPILEAPCAIGAPGTPTVTGSFEYNYKDRWDYGTYYVGPCLVFYRGYALHSVLLYQNGSEYDGRVGVKISHGCIRLKKKDIDFIAKTIPVGTRIYITP